MNIIRILALLLFSVCFAGLSVTAEGKTFVVNSTLDQVDAAPGDGICATAGGGSVPCVLPSRKPMPFQALTLSH